MKNTKKSAAINIRGFIFQQLGCINKVKKVENTLFVLKQLLVFTKNSPIVLIDFFNLHKNSPVLEQEAGIFLSKSPVLAPFSDYFPTEISLIPLTIKSKSIK